MQIHSGSFYFPPLIRTPFSTWSILILKGYLSWTWDIFFSKLRQIRTLSLSISKYIPLFIQSRWYFSKCSSYLAKFASIIDSIIGWYSGKTSSECSALNIFPRKILHGIKYLRTNFFCPELWTFIFWRFCSAYFILSLIRATFPFWKRKLFKNWTSISSTFLLLIIRLICS